MIKDEKCTSQYIPRETLRRVSTPQAYMYAKKYNLPGTAGADSHHHDIICSGIEVKEKFNTIFDYVELIKNNKEKRIIYADN